MVLYQPSSGGFIYNLVIVSHSSLPSMFRSNSVQTLVPALRLSVLGEQRDARAPNGQGHIALHVRVAARDARTRASQNDGGRVDGRAAVPHALLATGSRQTARAQAVGLGDEARVPQGVVGDAKKI
jgi:hypothetical protein